MTHERKVIERARAMAVEHFQPWDKAGNFVVKLADKSKALDQFARASQREVD